MNCKTRREIDARVIGFNYTTFHVYLTEIQVDGCKWTLNIRFNAFYQFYERLLALEKYFMVPFPPKGGLFFSPPPEERQKELDEFLLGTLAFFDMRGHPKRMEALLDELFEISKHLGMKEEEEEHTASEGSSEEHDEYLVSGHEDASNTTLESIGQDNNQVEAVSKEDDEELKSDVGDRVYAHSTIDSIEIETKPEAVKTNEGKQQVQMEGKAQQQTGIAAVIDCTTMQHCRMLVDGAVQSKVMSSIQEKAEKPQTIVEEETAAEEELISDDKAMEGEMQQTGTAIAEAEEKRVAAITETATLEQEVMTESISTQTAIETAALSPKSGVHDVDPVVYIEADHVEVVRTATGLDAVSVLAPDMKEELDEENELLGTMKSEELALELCKTESEAENPVVGWLRRVVTFSLSPDEKEELEVSRRQENEKEDTETAQAKAEVTKADVETAVQAEVKAAVEEAIVTEVQTDVETAVQAEVKVINDEADVTTAKNVVTHAEVKVSQAEVEVTQAEVKNTKGEANDITAENEDIKAEFEVASAQIEANKVGTEETEAEIKLTEAEVEVIDVETEVTKAEIEVTRAEVEVTRAGVEVTRVEVEAALPIEVKAAVQAEIKAAAQAEVDVTYAETEVTKAEVEMTRVEVEAALQAEAEVSNAEFKAAVQAEVEVIMAEVCTKVEEETKAKMIEVERLLAKQELNVRLTRYRYPVFFRNFNCKVGKSWYYLPQQLSNVVVM